MIGTIPGAQLGSWLIAKLPERPMRYAFATLLTLIGILILFVAYFAYKTDSNFGFVVFGLVGAAVAMTGIGMEAWENIVFGIVFILAIIWSILAKTPKNLTLILLTTALLFITVGLSKGIIDSDLSIAIGIFALLNGIFAVYLAFALALDDKLPVV
jgi:hypothetical protein